jgi:hypothetical protein
MRRRGVCGSVRREDAGLCGCLHIATLVEVLEQKSLCTKQDPYDIITEFRHKNPLIELGREVCRLWYSHLGWHDRIRRGA